MKIHLDLDCYFVSAERTRYPSLKGKKVVVAKGSDKHIFSKERKVGVMVGQSGAFNGLLEFKNNYDHRSAFRDEFVDSDGKIRGIVIAKSYECKPYNIKTGTPVVEALNLCADLVVIPSDHLFYVELSHKLREFLLTKIPKLETYSIDEYFGDLDGWVEDEDTLEFIANLQKEILEKFDLPITIAASKSKWIAKLMTDKIKPFGLKVLPQEAVEEVTKEYPIEDFSGVGKALAAKLKSYGVETLGQLRSSPHLLKSQGKIGVQLLSRVRGEDNEGVNPINERKGIGIGRNFDAILCREEILRRVIILARYLSHTITKLGLSPTTFHFKIKYENGIKSAQSTTKNRLFNERFFMKMCKDFFSELDTHPHYKIHYLSISTSNFIGSANHKTTSLLYFNEDKKFATLNQKLVELRDKYGVDIIKYGTEI